MLNSSFKVMGIGRAYYAGSSFGWYWATDFGGVVDTLLGSPPPTFSPIRVNSGGPAYTDPQGNVWSADTGFSSSYTWGVSASVGNTTTPALYLTCRYGAAVLSNFDIFAAAGGAMVAVDKVFPVTKSNGQITIQFSTGSANYPMVNAIEILTAGSGRGGADRACS